MPKEMLINVSAGEECRIAVVENGKLEELYMERASSISHVGNVYKGKVTNVEASIQAAFVDFGIGRNGFLHISDLMPTYFGRRGEGIKESVGRKMARRDRPPIQQCLRRGDEIIVQVIKEGIGTKGPTLSTYLSIPGRILVMMPGVGKSGVSKKIEDDEERRRLRDILDGLKPPKDVGFIIRTAGVGKSKQEIERDFKYLMRLWENIEKADTKKAPLELYAEGDLVMRTVRDVYTTDIESIVVDDKETAKRIKEFFKLLMPRTKNKVEVYEDSLPLFHKFNVEYDIEQMHSRTVPLPSGGSLVIDQTEAVTAIDVNSGKSRASGDAETTAYKTDLEAADEIPRQLKLRDLGGIVICDFIDLRFERHRRDLEARLAENLKRDRAKTRFLRMSEFGIVEMTRQRMRPSLKKSVFHDCPHCAGHGLVKTAESMGLDVLRRLAIAVHNERVQRVELSLHPDVAVQVLNKKRLGISELEQESDKRIVIKIDSHLALDQMKFELFDEREGMVWLPVLGMDPPQQGGGSRDRDRDRHGGGRGGRDGHRGGGGGRDHRDGGGRRDERHREDVRDHGHHREELEADDHEQDDEREVVPAVAARAPRREPDPEDVEREVIETGGVGAPLALDGPSAAADADGSDDEDESEQDDESGADESAQDDEGREDGIGQREQGGPVVGSAPGYSEVGDRDAGGRRRRRRRRGRRGRGGQGGEGGERAPDDRTPVVSNSGGGGGDRNQRDDRPQRDDHGSRDNRGPRDDRNQRNDRDHNRNDRDRNNRGPGRGGYVNGDRPNVYTNDPGVEEFTDDEVEDDVETPRQPVPSARGADDRGGRDARNDRGPARDGGPRDQRGGGGGREGHRDGGRDNRAPNNRDGRRDGGGGGGGGGGGQNAPRGDDRNRNQPPRDQRGGGGGGGGGGARGGRGDHRDRDRQPLPPVIKPVAPIDEDLIDEASGPGNSIHEPEPRRAPAGKGGRDRRGRMRGRGRGPTPEERTAARLPQPTADSLVARFLEQPVEITDAGEDDLGDEAVGNTAAPGERNAPAGDEGEGEGAGGGKRRRRRRGGRGRGGRSGEQGTGGGTGPTGRTVANAPPPPVQRTGSSDAHVVDEVEDKLPDVSDWLKTPVTPADLDVLPDYDDDE